MYQNSDLIRQRLTHLSTLNMELATHRLDLTNAALYTGFSFAVFMVAYPNWFASAVLVVPAFWLHRVIKQARRIATLTELAYSQFNGLAKHFDGEEIKLWEQEKANER